MNKNDVPNKIPINPSDLTDLECPNCKYKFFTTLNMIKAISPLKTRSGDVEFIPIPVLKCDACGNIIEDAKRIYEERKQMIIGG